MMTQETLRKLNEMKLIGMADAFQDQLSSTSALHLSFEERFAMLVDQELTSRDNRRLQRLLKGAKFKVNACIEDIDYNSQDRKLDRSEIATLALCDWIARGMNLIITGRTGSGKTWIACALGNQACRKGYSVLFKRLPLLLEELGVSHGDGTYLKRLNQLANVDLLILDDFGISPLKAVTRNDLLELTEQRNGNKSTIITSQLPVEKWHDYLSGGNPTVADAILDRIVSGSLRIAIDAKDTMRVLKFKK
jgi:DNA replication protein DnaC